MEIPYLRNSNIFAIACNAESDRITVGILAIKSKGVFGRPQTLYSDAGNSYEVLIPSNPQEFNEVLQYVGVAV